MVVMIGDVRCETGDVHIIGSKTGKDSGGQYQDFLVRSPKGEFYVYREHPFRIHSVLGVLTETEAREWLVGCEEFFPGETEFRLHPELWDLPGEGRARISVTLSDDVMAALRSVMHRSGDNLSLTINDVLREAIEGSAVHFTHVEDNPQ